MSKYKISGLSCLIVLLFFTCQVQAATLTLRPTNNPEAEMITIGISDTADFDVILALEDGEQISFTNIFLEVTEDTDAGSIEAFNFTAGLSNPPATYTRFPENFGFPFSSGEGVDLNEYGLIIANTNIAGPAEFTLDTISIRALMTGSTGAVFELGVRPPELFNLENELVMVDIPNNPLMIVVNETGGPGTGNGNGNGNANNNGNNGNTNGNGNGGMAAGGCGSFCGAGSMAAVLLSSFGLLLMSNKKRTRNK